MSEPTLPTSLVSEETAPVIVLDDPAPDPQPATTESADAARDRAWRMGDQFVWNGQKLAAFAIDREGDWRMHRAALGLPELGKVMSEAFLADALRIVWFCAHEPKQWLSLLADPERLELEIRKWAATSVKPGEQGDITALAIAIFNSAYTNRATAKDATDAPGE